LYSSPERILDSRFGSGVTQITSSNSPPKKSTNLQDQADADYQNCGRVTKLWRENAEDDLEMEIMITRFDRYASLLVDGGHTMMKGISSGAVAPRAAILRVRQEYCQGHARCSAIAPQLFVQDGLGPVRLIGDGTIPPELEKQARRAAACCPEQAIEIL